MVGLFDGASVGAAQSRLDEQMAPATPHLPLAPTGSATPSSKLASKATVGLGVAAANFSRADTAATMTSAKRRVVEAEGMAMWVCPRACACSTEITLSLCAELLLVRL